MPTTMMGKRFSSIEYLILMTRYDTFTDIMIMTLPEGKLQPEWPQSLEVRQQLKQHMSMQKMGHIRKHNIT